jgi:molecular chaperone DnaK (HSP70)
MSGESSAGAPGARHAIGISFGNSNSSIAITGSDDKAEVIANEDGGMTASTYTIRCNTIIRELIMI